jgi:hypothetical protein
VDVDLGTFATALCVRVDDLLKTYSAVVRCGHG